MALKKYDVEINGYKTTLLLSDEDAKAQGLLADKAAEPTKKAAPKAANKARTASNKKA